MPYQPDTVVRLVALYDWFADTVRNNSQYFRYMPGSLSGTGDVTVPQQDPFISQPHGSVRVGDEIVETNVNYNSAYVSLFEMVKQFEQTLADVDKLPANAFRAAAETAWDAAVAEFEGDVDTDLSGEALAIPESLMAAEALDAGNAVEVFYEGTVLKVRKATGVGIRFGFIKVAAALGALVDVWYEGKNEGVVHTEEEGTTAPAISAYWRYFPSVDNPGQYVLHKGGTNVATIPMQAFGGLRYLGDQVGIIDNRTFVQAAQNTLGMAIVADRYKSRLQHVLISGGISPLGKGDADTGSGDGCWRDPGDDYYWEVLVGEEKYANAFTGVAYYSSLKYPGGVVVNGTVTPSEGYYSTREFGFILDIPCKEELQVGDQVVLVIGNAGVEPTYQKGDRLFLGLVAAQNIDFFGGNDGDNVQTWHVQDSVDGALTPYALDTDAPVAYASGGGLGFLITQGAIPYVKGDKYKFSIEGGNFRWRKTVTGGAPGAWSGATDITLAPIVLDSGLSLEWKLGASPAIIAGDEYAFLALQPYALSNLIRPDFDKWEWAVDPAPVVIDLGVATPIEAVALAFHTLPTAAVVTIEGGVAPGVYTWNSAIVWRKDVMAVLLAAPANARYLRLTVAGTVAGGIGWLYAGEAVKMTYSAQVQLQREYKMKRSDGVNPNSLYQGMGSSGTITFPEGHVLEADYDKLTEMLDWLKANDDEALIFYPQETRTDEIILATVESDEISFSDVFQFQPGAAYERRISCTIPLRGVAFK